MVRWLLPVTDRNSTDADVEEPSSTEFIKKFLTRLVISDPVFNVIFILFPDL
jgi:hypothetical protein